MTVYITGPVIKQELVNAYYVPGRRAAESGTSDIGMVDVIFMHLLFRYHRERKPGGGRFCPPGKLNETQGFRQKVPFRPDFCSKRQHFSLFLLLPYWALCLQSVLFYIFDMRKLRKALIIPDE